MASDNWYTPLNIVLPIREFYNFTIDYDPCSCAVANLSIKAKHFSSIGNDFDPSLWTGNIWLNPPYCGGAMQAWLERANKVYSESSEAKQIIALVNRSDANWYYDFVDNHPHAYYQFRNRIKFIDGDTGQRSSPRYNNDLFYWGDDSERFMRMCRSSFGKPTPHTFWK